MPNATVRIALAIAAGLVAALLVVAVFEAAGHALFPPPAGLDLTRPADQARLMEVMPVEAKIAVVAAWFLGSLAGACTAIAISRRTLPGWIVGLTLVGLSLWTTQLLPHPAWMVVSAVVLPMVGVVLAKGLLAARTEGA
jgi:hypothetical protein